MNLLILRFGGFLIYSAIIAFLAIQGWAAPQKSASHRGNEGRIVSAPFLLPRVVYYGGIRARNISVLGSQALEATAPANGKNAWDEAVQEKLPQSIAQGEVLHATFMIRVDRPTPNATVVFNVEGGPPAYTKTVSQVIKLTAQWKKVSIPFTASIALPAGAADFDFFLDTVPQTVQIANFQVVAWGKTK